MQNFSDISIVIPVREGSSRIKDKIFLPFHEQLTLLEWKIDQIKKVQTADRIFLSSNSNKVAQIAQAMGVEFLPRNEYLSVGHQASFSEVITGVVSELPTDHFAWVTVVVPLMAPSDYKKGFELYIENVINNTN